MMPLELTLDKALARALELAARGNPWGGNPRVGCVLLGESGVFLAEGFHRGRGSAHAEADALHNLAQNARKGGEKLHTALVTLEPCNHYGLTPPCARALLEAGVKRVIYGDADTTEQAGGGARTLRQAGVETLSAEEAGVNPLLVAKVHEFNELWLAPTRRRRPWVLTKTAASLDGYAAGSDGRSQWITGEISREIGHRIRAICDAIVVGTGTLTADHPRLTARPGGIEASHQPRRVIVGFRKNPWPEDYRDAMQWESHDLPGLLAELYEQHCRVVLVEGGPTLVAAALKAGVVDESLVFSAPKVLGAGKPCLPVGAPALDKALVAPFVHYHPLKPDTAGQRDLLTVLEWNRETPGGMVQSTTVLDGLTPEPLGGNECLPD